MNIKNYLAIATATVALTVTAFGQWHPEIDKVKTRRPQTQSIQSPRDVASGQATGRRKAPSARQDKLGNFEIQDLKSPRDSQTGQATGKRQHKPITKRPGFMDYTDDACSTCDGKVVAGQNSGGTITNQRSRRPNRRK